MAKSRGRNANRAAVDEVPAEAPVETPVETGKKRKHRPMSAPVREANEPVYDKMVELADKLGCKLADLLWVAVQGLLDSPPTEAPEGATPQTGTAPGYWIVPDTNKSGKATSITVLEVEKRTDAKGRTFFRYKKDDSKARDRARTQALRAASYDLTLLGLPKESVTIEEFED